MSASGSGLFSPTDLKKIAEEKEMAKLQEVLERKRKEDHAQQELKEAFMEQDLRPDVAERLGRALRNAAEAGQTELLVMRFPAAFCTDHGRAINNFDPDWPETLTGFAKRGYEYYKKELAPLGYHARAEILSYPDGNLGEAGIYLKW